MGRLLIPLASMALLLPARLGEFDGVPLDRWPEFSLLFVLLPFALSGRLRREIDRRLPSWGAPAAVGLLAVALVAKFVLLAAGPNPGFDSCYRSTVAEPVVGECEVSFADPFRLSGATRVDRELVYGLRLADPAAAALGGRLVLRDGALTQSNWQLSPFNSNRLDFIHSDPTSIDRDRLPFTLRSSGDVDLAEPATVRVTYAGEGELTLGERSFSLAPAYEGPKTVTLRAEPGRQPLELRFAFRRIRRYGDPVAPSVTYAALVVDDADGDPLEVASPAWGWRALAGLVTGIVAVAGIALALLALWLLRSYWWLAGVIALLALFAVGVESPHELGPLGLFPQSAAYVLALGAVLAGLLVRPGPHPLLFAWGAVAGLAALRTFNDFPFADVVFYPNGGDDPLTYQSQASEILATWSPRGGEDAFFFQPGYRYVLFLGRLLFGPVEPFLSTAGLAGLGMGIFYLVRRLGLMGGEAWPVRLGAFVAAGLLLGVVNSDVIVGTNLRVLNSEWVSWILFPFGAGLLLGGRERSHWLAGSALLGLEAIVRVNQLPLVLAVFAIFLLSLPRERLRLGLACGVAALPFLLFPLAHNLGYGSTFAPFTTQASTSAPLGVKPRELLDFPSDSDVRERVGDQLARVLYLEPLRIDATRPDTRANDLEKYVYGLELLWLAAVGVAAVWRRRLTTASLAALGLPVVAVLPYALYDLVVYYPRHTVVGWLAFGATTLYLLSPLARREDEVPLRDRARAALAARPRWRAPRRGASRAGPEA